MDVEIPGKIQTDLCCIAQQKVAEEMHITGMYFCQHPIRQLLTQLQSELHLKHKLTDE